MTQVSSKGKSLQWIVAAMAIMAGIAVTGAHFVDQSDGHSESAVNGLNARRLMGYRRVTVYTAVPDEESSERNKAMARKQLSDLRSTLRGDEVTLDPVAMTLPEQKDFVEKHCDVAAVERMNKFIEIHQKHLATEVFKYCSLQQKGYMADAAAFIDSTSPVLNRIHSALAQSKSVAVLGDDYFPNTIHGSLIMLHDDHSYIAKQMMKLLLETDVEVLISHPLLLPQRLYDHLVKATGTSKPIPGDNAGNVFFLEEKCIMEPMKRHTLESSSWTDAESQRLVHRCPEHSGFCCNIHTKDEVLLMTRHPLLPYQKLPKTFARPYNSEAEHFNEDELPYIATISEKRHERPADLGDTPNYYQMLEEKDCLPSNDDGTCLKCLRDKKGADCDTCAKVCTCYCKSLCSDTPPAKHVHKTLTITPPVYRRDPNRIIPRIVHQTWFEELDPEKYPNMSRLAQSFKMSGWEYKFYTDDVAGNFLSTHFPPEVREAYDSLRPGAFKADLFRYCVLLIHGGVYSDVDIMLEAALDAAVSPDVGFMVPIDEPGKPVDRRMCLWNGMIAAAPGHPFLAQAIETVVNQVRNRFTSVDMDATYCPNPELSVLHAFDTLFTAGPCLLGASINRVLGVHPQTSFAAGEIDILKDKVALKKGSNSIIIPETVPLDHRIPGKTVILHQDKWDMGAHRFTDLDKNLVVSATDLQDADDRQKISTSGGKKTEHYSKTHAKTGIYGLESLYTPGKAANENLRFVVDLEQESKVKEF